MCRQAFMFGVYVHHHHRVVIVRLSRTRSWCKTNENERIQVRRLAATASQVFFVFYLLLPVLSCCQCRARSRFRSNWHFLLSILLQRRQNGKHFFSYLFIRWIRMVRCGVRAIGAPYASSLPRARAPHMCSKISAFFTSHNSTRIIPSYEYYT